MLITSKTSDMFVEKFIF